jgi:hypothetical protein
MNNGTINLATVAPGAVCNQNQLGSIVSQNPATTTGSIVANQLQCTYSPFICEGPDPNKVQRQGFCYLPIADNEISFTPNMPKAYCPAGYFISGSAQVSSTCSCSSGSPVSQPVPVNFGYSYGNYAVNIGVEGVCTCSDDSQGQANVTQMTCSDNNPAITYTPN